MKKESLIALSLILSLCAAPLFGQTNAPAAATAPQQQDDDEVVRITTNLVQVDAVVMDKSGKQVTDLRPEEFEILEDERPQAITNFSYVSTDTANSGSAPKSSSAAAAAASNRDASVRPARVRPTDTHRTILLVVDDLGLTSESAIATRRALKKFVEDQLRPNDLAAVVNTSGGSSAAQQLTADKKTLLAAVEQVRWNPLARSGQDTFSYGTGSNNDLSRSGPNLPVANSSPPSIPSPGNGIGPGAPLEDSIKALSFILGGLKQLPGRKSVVLFSDNFTIFPGLKGNELEQYERMLRTPGGGGVEAKDAGSSAKAVEQQLEEMELRNIALSDGRQRTVNTQEQLAKLLDLANQVSAVIYTLDPRGLLVYNLAADTTGKQALGTGNSPGSLDNLMSNRSLKVRQTQVSLEYVARQTGGFLIHNTTDLNSGLQRVLDDTAGYYLLGYRPAEGTFEKNAGGRSRFHKIRINVKRPGLSVRSRKGFFSNGGDEPRAAAAASTIPRTRDEQLMAAINAPFQSGGVNLRLTTLFVNEAPGGSFLRTLLHVDANSLTFKPDAEGWQTALMDVLAMTFDERGGVIEQVARHEAIQVKGATQQRLLRNGLVYAFDVPVKKAGSYQLRVAVRDAASERTGSAQQLIEAPDLTSAKLALSGIFARGVDPAVAGSASLKVDTTAGLLSGPPKISDAEATTDSVIVQPGPEARRLRRGLALEYRYTIFNAQHEGATDSPSLQTQTMLFRDGQRVWAGEPKAVDVIDENDEGTAIATGGRLMLGAEMTPGEYVLQVVVTDTLAGGEKRTATQAIDFEVVK
ncbi:MAG: hypothetical protein QOF02_3149 [Blastocatellia bacterium]|nr:hypothetical protein [Blastocatellia bacterium]